MDGNWLTTTESFMSVEKYMLNNDVYSLIFQLFKGYHSLVKDYLKWTEQIWHDFKIVSTYIK